MADIHLEEERTSEKKKKVGHYMLGRKIGEGRYATVRLGTHNIAHQKAQESRSSGLRRLCAKITLEMGAVAVKVIPKKVLAQKEAARRHFRRQALLSQYVQHPNIARLYEAMETPNSYYLVLELAERGQFCQYLAQKRCLDEEETRLFARQLVSAVDHMHVSGVVHRDLRLDNLLLDKESKLKICATHLYMKIHNEYLGAIPNQATMCALLLGSICLQGFGQGSQPVPGPSTSLQGLSPAYVAPEMFSGKLGGPAADIWSIGVCVYTMLTGKLPFVSDTPSTIQQIHNNILQGCKMPDSLSEHCKNFLNRLLEPSEGKRLTMGDLLVHPWLTSEGRFPVQRYPSVMKVTPEAFDFTTVRYLCQYFDFSESDLLYSVSERKVDSACAAYQLMLKSMESGFHPPGMSTRSDTTPSTLSSLTSSDSAPSQGGDPDSRLPQVKTAPSYTSVRELTSLRPVSYKSTVMGPRENRWKNARINRPKSFDPQMMPNVRNKKPFVSRSSKEKLPDIKNTRAHSPDPKYGAFGRHRDAWDNSDSDLLNVRGKSPVRNGGYYVSYNSLTPQIMTFDPPAPPNTASGMRHRVKGGKSEQGSSETDRRKTVAFGAVSESPPEEEELDQLERQKSRILCSVDLSTQKRPLSYGQPLSAPKKLSMREQRNATVAVFKRISEQNAVRRALRWDPELTIARSPTALSTESVEKDDFLGPIIKVTISTCKS